MGTESGIRNMTVGSPFRHILMFTLPLLAGNFLQQFYNMVDSWVVGNYVSDGALAAVGVGFPVIFLFTSLFSGIATGGTVVIAQFYGAGKLDRVKKGMNKTLWIGIVYTVVTGALILLFADPIMRLFTDDPGVVAYGKQAMRYFCPFYWLLSILHGLAGTIRGTGKSIPPMAVLLISLCLFRIFWIQLILPHYTTIDGIFVLYPISWAVGVVLMILYTIFGHWLYPVNHKDKFHQE